MVDFRRRAPEKPMNTDHEVIKARRCYSMCIIDTAVADLYLNVEANMLTVICVNVLSTWVSNAVLVRLGSGSKLTDNNKMTPSLCYMCPHVYIRWLSYNFTYWDIWCTGALQELVVRLGSGSKSIDNNKMTSSLGYSCSHAPIYRLSYDVTCWDM